MNIDKNSTIYRLYNPFINIPTRLGALKNWIAIGLILSIIPSYKLWLTDRFFPMIPFFENLNQIPHPYDKIVFGIFLALPFLFILFRKPRLLIVTFLFLAAYMVISDQNRLQPWFYQYALMLFVLSFYNWRVDEPKSYTVIIFTLKIIVVMLYFWSGIQKMNHHFFQETWPWLIQPLKAVFTNEQMNVITKMGYFVPFLEMLLGIGLMFNSTKKIAIPLLIFMHLSLLIVLSPLGHNYNNVVWGWNFAMIFILYFLFAGTHEAKHTHINYILEFKPVYVIVFLCCLMPALNLFNSWDSYLSSTLYSGNTSNGIVYLSSEAKDNLPNIAKDFTTPIKTGEHKLSIKNWSMQELGVPSYPEKRIFEAVTNKIKKLTGQKGEVRLYFKEKLSFLGEN